MKTEAEVRQEIENFDNADKNFRFLAEKTGDKSLMLKAMENNIGKNVLKWVLDEFEFKEETVMMDMGGGR